MWCASVLIDWVRSLPEWNSTSFQCAYPNIDLGTYGQQIQMLLAQDSAFKKLLGKVDASSTKTPVVTGTTHSKWRASWISKHLHQGLLWILVLYQPDPIWLHGPQYPMWPDSVSIMSQTLLIILKGLTVYHKATQVLHGLLSNPSRFSVWFRITMERNLWVCLWEIF